MYLFLFLFKFRDIFNAIFVSTEVRVWEFCFWERKNEWNKYRKKRNRKKKEI